MTQTTQQFISRIRRGLVLFALLSGMISLAGRAVFLQHYEAEFLRDEGDARHLRVLNVSAHRGMITDRNGEPLAISTPVDSVWANPPQTMQAPGKLLELAKLLDLSKDELLQRLANRSSKAFVYLKRHVNPDIATRVMALDVPGINLQREYRRYYPMGEVTAHVLGFTNIDDQGQEGLELSFQDWLDGEPGAKWVIKDRLGRVVEDVARLKASRPGKDLQLSLDKRIQYLAYRELKAAVRKHKARSGSVVVVDAHRGEVLAMVNQPSFNPNHRRNLRGQLTRNRAVTDVFEPGSTVKPFTIAAALEAGRFKPKSVIDTSPGWYMVRGHTIQDQHDYGAITLGKVISKSSNVGASKIALSIPAKYLWETFHDMGFGAITDSGFPGESAGLLSDFARWRKIERATLSFGYGLSTTALQLAQAYTVLATDGLRPSISFLLADKLTQTQRVLSPRTGHQLRKMLEGVVSAEGTALSARVDGYRVAGKTGTVHKSTPGGYAKDRYISVFAGMAPASTPRLVIVVVINEPSNGEYYGGVVAAPVFSNVMSGALRLLNISPDDLPDLQQVEWIKRAESA